MPSKITDPNLLQCSRVDVLDVRPVIENGGEPFASIRYNLSTLEDDSTLLVVAPFEPRPLKKYVQREGFSLVHEEVSRRMHWLGVHAGPPSPEVEINGPGPSYVLPAGKSGHVGYLDCRSMESNAVNEWITTALSGLSDGDLLVVHRPPSEADQRADFKNGTVSRKSIFSDHVRVEIQVGTPETV